MYGFFCKQRYLARLNLEKDIFKAENETIYSTNDHLWHSKLCPRTENTLCCWGRRRKGKSQWAERRAEIDSNILFYNPWVFDYFCVASCNNNATFVWFSLICLESLGTCKNQEKQLLHRVLNNSEKQLFQGVLNKSC